MMLDGIAVKKQDAAAVPKATGVSCRASQRPDMHFTTRDFIYDSHEMLETARDLFVFKRREPMRSPSRGGLL